MLLTFTLEQTCDFFDYVYLLSLYEVLNNYIKFHYIYYYTASDFNFGTQISTLNLTLLWSTVAE